MQIRGTFYWPGVYQTTTPTQRQGRWASTRQPPGRTSARGSTKRCLAVKKNTVRVASVLELGPRGAGNDMFSKLAEHLGVPTEPGPLYLFGGGG